jgi:ADP-heptose:LPS heptosyltransferase
VQDWIARKDLDLPVFEQRRQVLAAAGFSLEPARFDLAPPAEARQWAAKTVPTGAVHLSINASGPEKEWPLAHWAALAKRLLGAKPDLALIATAGAKPRERERLNQLRAAVNDPRLGGFEGLSIAQLAALLERCQLHIGGDSGVLHLAMALGIPTFGLFRQYEGLQEWKPRGKAHRHLAAPSLDSVTDETVAREVEQMLRPR